MKSVAQEIGRKRLTITLVLVLVLSPFVSGVQPSNERARMVAAVSAAVPLSTSVFRPSLHNTDKAALATGIFSSRMVPSLGFAVADFTGDSHPDLATVEVEQIDSARAQYWIDVRLTEGTNQILTLTAPFGGLLITPRDVTGDGKLDLLVHAPTSRVLLAVFLNDGNGHFSAGRIAAFANALFDESSRFEYATQSVYLSPAPACTESHTVECRMAALFNLPRQTRAPIPANAPLSSPLFLSFSSDRAPPIKS